jgi:hypothetical protein
MRTQKGRILIIAAIIAAISAPSLSCAIAASDRVYSVRFLYIRPLVPRGNLHGGARSKVGSYPRFRQPETRFSS